jgi:hypothetical protein
MDTIAEFPQVIKDVTKPKMAFLGSITDHISKGRERILFYQQVAAEWREPSHFIKVVRREISEAPSRAAADEAQIKLTDLEAASRPNSPMFFAARKAIGQAREPVKVWTFEMILMGKDFARKWMLLVEQLEKAFAASLGCAPEPTYARAYIIGFIRELENLAIYINRQERCRLDYVGGVDRWLDCPDSAISAAIPRQPGPREILNWSLMIKGDPQLPDGGKSPDLAVLAKPLKPGASSSEHDEGPEEVVSDGTIREGVGELATAPPGAGADATQPHSVW